ncbi:hypothetical protein NQ315_004600 [Exocentrus adspersus]|uniref:Lipase domain-containing protein n=1 Tax=Exocentrus adspersus TaxID=1586481 RepID=A0AAV8VNI1_9CUCU|nr:hypothetical protein NQ315_004600 [Exocentrus adspersus]
MFLLLVILVYCSSPVNSFLFPIVYLDRLYNYTPPENEVTFFLYHRSNPTKENQIFIGDKESIHRSRFEPELPTRIIIHGWTHGKNVPAFVEMREVMARAHLGNVILVDWAPLSHVIYVEARVHNVVVAKQVTNLLLFLREYTNIRMSSVHLIGHSMGAQIAAMTGNRIKTQINQMIGRISGLDPAAPLFEWPHIESLDDVLDPSDALFVDVIHTNGRHLGMITPAGHVDYYPNGGVCSHSKALDYWIASIRKPNLFKAYAYKSWDEYVKGRAGNLKSYPMGIAANPDIPHGIYFVKTDQNVEKYHKTKTTMKDSLIKY